MVKARCRCGKSEITFKYLKAEDVAGFENKCCPPKVIQPEPVEVPKIEAAIVAKPATRRSRKTPAEKITQE